MRRSMIVWAVGAAAMLAGCDAGMRTYDFGETRSIDKNGQPVTQWHGKATLGANIKAANVDITRNENGTFHIGVGSVDSDVAPAWQGRNTQTLYTWNGIIGSINALGQFVPLAGGGVTQPAQLPTIVNLNPTTQPR